MKRWGSVPVLIGLLALPVPSRGKEKKPDDVRYDVSVERVEVDILALDQNGSFVNGLTRDDFEVFEEGKPVEIVDFELRHLSPNGSFQNGSIQQVSVAPAVAPEPPEGRKFILFIDLIGCSPRAIDAIKPDLLRFMDRVLTPADQVMISILAPNRRALVLQKFTNVRDRLRPAIEVLRGTPSAANRERSNEEDIYNLLYNQSIREMGLAQSLLRIQMTGDVVRNIAAEEYQRAAHSFNALASVVERVEQAGWQRGRKAVIFVSESMAWHPAQALADIVNRRVEEHNTWLEVLSSGDSSGGNLQHLRAYRLNLDYDLDTLLNTTVGRLNRIGATLYTIDSRGIFESDTESVSRPQRSLTSGQQRMAFFESQDSLASLAADTGGVAFFNRMRFDGVLQTIERDNRVRYFLTYQPPKHKPGKKPKFYSIKIRCKRPDVSLRARKGYLD